MSARDAGTDETEEKAMPEETKTATLVDVQRFFDIPMNKFRAEWGKLTDKDKAELKSGLSDGTLTY